MCWNAKDLLTAFLKPKYAPRKVSGTEMQNHRANMATRVPKGMAADEPSPHRIRFITKKSANTTLRNTGQSEELSTDWQSPSGHWVAITSELNATLPDMCTSRKQPHPGQRNDVSRTLVFHFSPPKADVGKHKNEFQRKNLKEATITFNFQSNF